MPSVSVIVPNYNHARFLTERLDSIFNQTFQDFEVILLDDCSTDNSQEILKKYAADPRVSHLIISEKNSGSPFIQWQKGMRLATGDYIWIAESDDWCDHNFLAELIPPMQSDSSLVLAYAQSNIVLPDLSVAWTTHNIFSEDKIPGKQFVRQCMIEGNAIINSSMAVFRRTVLDKITTKYTDFLFCGDWLFWTETALQGNVYTTNKALNYFRNHSGEVSHFANKSGLSYLEELAVLKIFLKRTYINDQAFRRGIKAKYVRFKLEEKGMSRDAAKKIGAIFDSVDFGELFSIERQIAVIKRRLLVLLHNFIVTVKRKWR